MRSWLLLLFLPPAWAAAGAGSEPADPSPHAARSPSGPLCKAGQYLTEDCYMGQASGCCPCPPGTFLSHPNREASCTRCTVCREDQEVVSNCTPTQDRHCQCKPGEYYCASEHCPESCHPCTSCPGATLHACTPTRDTVCAPVAPTQPGPADASLAVSTLALVVAGVALFIAVVVVVAAVVFAVAWWRRGAAPVEPGSHGHILQTRDPESGPPAPDAETSPMLQEEAPAPTPAA